MQSFFFFHLYHGHNTIFSVFNISIICFLLTFFVFIGDKLPPFFYIVIIYYCYLFVEVVPFVTTQDTKKQLGQVLDKMVNKKNVSWIVMTNRYFEDGTREEDGKSVLFKGSTIYSSWTSWLLEMFKMVNWMRLLKFIELLLKSGTQPDHKKVQLKQHIINKLNNSWIVICHNCVLQW